MEVLQKPKNTFMWNLKYDTNELIYEIETDLQTQKTDLIAKQEGGFGKEGMGIWYQFSSVPSLSRVQLFVTPWTAAQQATLSITNSWSLLKLMSIESVMPSNHPSFVVPFSPCLQSFLASRSFPMGLVQQMQTIICRMDKQQGPTVQHREL